MKFDWEIFKEIIKLTLMSFGFILALIIVLGIAITIVKFFMPFLGIFPSIIVGFISTILAIATLAGFYSGYKNK
jgi:hypothetical protein